MLDRREFQRLKLLKPILGTVDGQGALILDIGVGGAFIEHYGQATQGDQFRLGFVSEGSSVEFVCEVRRSIIVRLAS
ncbi:MAG TPA: PilZ domain-containing protein, partial [Thermoanaerobaculia bacterium]|nr:PilZ domain-containing protein [Thermoanaerobaculia bacterium]